MAIATTPNFTFAYLAESAWGTTPASALKALRITGESLAPDLSTTKAVEITGNREVQDLIRTQGMGRGGVNFLCSYGNIDDLLEGMFMGTWSTNVLAAGSTFKSFTLEKKFNDVTRFHTYKGSVVDGMNLNVRVGSPIDGSLSFLTKLPISAAVTAGSGAYTAAGTNPVMNAIDHVQLLNENGSPLANATEVTLSMKNNMRAQMALANTSPVGMGMGMFEVEGTLTAFFSDDTLLGEFLAFSQTSLALTIGGASTLKYAFLFSKMKYGKCEITASAPNSDIMVKLGWTAYYDATNSTAKITRTP